ncbi:MAG: hypothetical protein CBB71_21295 [Rhodopirellula sp. TMED11]|nr:MAG: hypothetical protein CBB71_21295 [Rhodopirellula sp. TMED11]
MEAVGGPGNSNFIGVPISGDGRGAARPRILIHALNSPSEVAKNSGLFTGKWTCFPDQARPTAWLGL